MTNIDLLLLTHAARRLGVRPSTLEQWTDTGVGPLPEQSGRYRSDLVDGWARETQDQLQPAVVPELDNRDD